MKTLEWSIHANDLAKVAQLTPIEIEQIEARAKTMYESHQTPKVIMDDVQVIIERRYAAQPNDGAMPRAVNNQKI